MLARPLLALSFAVVTSGSVQAGEEAAAFVNVQYRADAQQTIRCASGWLCSVQLEPGERIRDGLNSEAGLFESHAIYAGAGSEQTVYLTFKPSAPNLHANAIVTTSRRLYRLLLESTSAQHPTYYAFRFDDERRIAERHEARMRVQRVAALPSPAPTVAPITTLDAACASMAQATWRTDPTPADFRPRQVCETNDHTFIALPAAGKEPSDLPVPLSVTPDGDRPVNYRYDADARVFILDVTAREFVLIATAGNKQIRMRVQRVGVGQ